MHYRDCFEVLARAVLRRERLGGLGRQARIELRGCIDRFEEVEVHGHVLWMLKNIASCNELTSYNFDII